MKKIWILCAVLAWSMGAFANKGFETITLAPVLDIDIISTDSNVIQGSFADQLSLTRTFAITPDGTLGVVVPFVAGQKVSIFDTTTYESTVVTGPNPAELFWVAITPDNKFGFVTDSLNKVVYVLDLTTRAFTGQSIAVGNNPFGIAITPDGKRAFVGTTSTVSVIDLATFNVTTINSPFFDAATDVVITPDGKKALVTNNGIINPGVVVIDTTTFATNLISGTGARLQGIALSPDGSRAYVSNFTLGTVSVIDVAANQVIFTIPGFIAPRYLTVTPDGDRLYVPNSNSNFTSIVDVSTNTVIGTITNSNFGPFQVLFIPNPSFALTGCQKVNKFLFRTDRFNVITLTQNPFGPEIVLYQIYRDPGLKQLAAEITASGDSVQFCDHGRKKGQCCTYFVVATSIFGDSVVKSITL